MPLFVYRCPTTGRFVQGFSAEDVSEDAHTFELVRCTACKGFHPVNPATGKVLGEQDEHATSRNTPPARST